MRVRLVLAGIRVWLAWIFFLIVTTAVSIVAVIGLGLTGHGKLGVAIGDLVSGYFMIGITLTLIAGAILLIAGKIRIHI